MQNFGNMCITVYQDNSLWAKLATHDVIGIWVGFTKGFHVYNPKTQNNILTKDVPFLQKPCSDWSKVKKPVLVPISYKGSDDNKELKIVPLINQNNNDNNYNVVSDSESKNADGGNLFDEDVNKEVEATPRIIVNGKVVKQWKNYKLCIAAMQTKLSKKQLKKKILKVWIFDQPRMSLRCSMEPGVIQIWNHKEDGIHLFKRHLGTWTSNWYGRKCIKVLCPSIVGV